MLDQVVTILSRARTVVAMTGAGVSAESGVPTFRGAEGLWGKFRPEELATMEAFTANSKLVWEWYNWRREMIRGVAPNPGHYALAELEQLSRSFTLITQNVDNLHRLAGSHRLLEIHGNIMRNICASCRKPFPDDTDIDPAHLPMCSHCSGKIRPDVVWFGEMLPEAVIQEAFDRADEADVFLSIGTSALVHPAASIPLLAKQRGATLVEINPELTPLSGIADFVFPNKSGELLPELVNRLRVLLGGKQGERNGSGARITNTSS